MTFELPARPAPRPRATRWPLVAAGAAALAALVLVSEGAPRAARAAALYSAWRAEEARLSGGDPRAELARLDAERGRLRARAGGALVELPRSGELSAVLAVVNGAADSSGVVVTGVEPGDPVPGAGFETLPVRLSVRGPAHAVGRFVSAVERARYPLRVRALTVTGPGLTAGPVTAEVRLEAPQALGERPPGGRP